MENKELCAHCNMDLTIRNPSGSCDHLYYPENCDFCFNVSMGNSVRVSREFVEAAKALKVAANNFVNAHDEQLKEWGKTREYLLKEYHKAHARFEKALGKV